jgi:hypothetical protein
MASSVGMIIEAAISRGGQRWADEFPRAHGTVAVSSHPAGSGSSSVVRLPRGALPVGLRGNAIAGAWWVDLVVALLIAAEAVKKAPKPGAVRAVAWRPRSTPTGSKRTATRTTAARE